MSPQVLQLLQTALAAHNAGRLADAEPLYRDALKQDPGNVDALHLLGVLLGQRGWGAEGVPLLTAAIQKMPNSVEFRLHLGDLLENMARHGEALDAYGAAIRLDPAHAEAHAAAGRMLAAMRQWAPAVEALRRAAELRTRDSDILCNFGAVLSMAGRAAEAIPVLQQAIALAPSLGAAWYRLGEALWNERQYDQALPAVRRAVELLPNETDAILLLGNTLLTLGRFDEAADVYRCRLSRSPNDAAARANLALTLLQLAQPHEALRIYDELLAQQPDHIGARANRALARLVIGDFRGGWIDYEARWNTPDLAGSITSDRPRWDGSDLTGRTIILTSEQGMGDTIQFVRYAPMVAARGGRVIVACPRELREVIAAAPAIAGTMVLGEPPPPFDVYAPLASLPGLFETTLETIPADVPYLRADPARVESWRQRLAREARMKIGLVWGGSPIHQNDRARSCPLSAFAPLAQVRNVAFYSLQKGERARDAASPPAGMTLVPLGDALNDYADTAALLQCLDLLIAVDTSVIHLAGALAGPVWALIPYGPDWRWMLDREDSPWYPTMRLFRQSEVGNWSSVLERIAKELHEWAGGRSS